MKQGQMLQRDEGISVPQNKHLIFQSSSHGKHFQEAIWAG